MIPSTHSPLACPWALAHTTPLLSKPFIPISSCSFFSETQLKCHFFRGIFPGLPQADAISLRPKLQFISVFIS